jgi:hypothetical protein
MPLDVCVTESGPFRTRPLGRPETKADFRSVSGWVDDNLPSNADMGCNFGGSGDGS